MRRTSAQGHGGHEECDGGALQRDMDMTGTRAKCQSASSARPERVYGVSSMHAVGIFVAKRVQHVVLRVLVTVQQWDGQNRHCGDLWLKLKSDAANFRQRQSSHVGDWGGVSLSSGM
jgi:hypothetical protein